MQCAVVPGPGSQAGAALPPPSNPPGPVNPTTCSQVQNIRVNVHFLQHDGTGNFGPNDDGRPGNPSYNDTGYGYAQVLIGTCNDQMDRNPVLNLAPGSSLTHIPKRVRWVLDGVYFDRSSFYRDGAGANGSAVHDYAPLCVRADSVVNIFLVEEVDWPYNGNGAVTTPQTRGYVFGSNQVNCNLYPAPAKLWAVISSPWTKYILAGTGAWEMSAALNHELCHLLGLNHPHQYNQFSWGVCPEAPMNANCWNLNEPAGPNCDSLNKVSNNLMDYNAAQSSLAPCQIGIIQNNLNTCLKSRFVYKCSDCLPATAMFEIAPLSGCMPTPIWLDGRTAFNYNWYKLEIDEVASSGAIVAGTHYESQTYFQAIDRIRLDAVYQFAASRSYRVKLSTHPSCAAVATAVQVRTFTTPPCVRLPDPQRSAQPATSATTTTSVPHK